MLLKPPTPHSVNLIGFANCRVELCLKPHCSEYWGAEADKQCQEKDQDSWSEWQKKPTHLDPFNRNAQHIKLSPSLCARMETQVTYALKQIRCARVRQHQLGTRPWVYLWDKISVLVWNCLFRVLLPCALMPVGSLIGCHLMRKC